MNIFSALSVIAFTIYLYVGIYAYMKNRKSKMTFLFFVLCLSMAVWSFAYAYVYVSKADHDIWIKLSAVGWCSFSAIILHLALMYTENKAVQKKYVEALIYIPAIVFFYISAFMFWPDRSPNQYVQAFFYIGNFTYNFVYLLTSITLVYLWGRRSKYIRHKKQAGIIVLTGIIPFTLDLIIQITQALYGKTPIPPSGQILALITILGAYYAVVKYGLFEISANEVIDEVLAEMMDIFILITPDGTVKRVNRQLEKLLGFHKDELIGKKLTVILDNYKVMGEILREKNHFGIHSYKDIRFKSKDGVRIPVNISCSALIDKELKDLRGIVLVGQDMRVTKKLEITISEQKATEEKLIESEERFRSMFYKHTAVMFLVDVNTLSVFEANEAAQKYYGYTLEEFRNKRMIDLDVMCETEMEETIERIKSKSIEFYFSRHRLVNGEFRDVEIHAAPIRNRSKQMIFAIVNDITERKKAEEYIAFLAYHDSLTGLPNRKYFYEKLGQELERAKRKDEVFAVLFIDLDGFKHINDTMGHKAGDSLLCETGKRIKGCIRESDMVARIGGDEFVVLVLDSKGFSDAETVAGKLLNTINEPILINGEATSIDASIGISIYPEDGGDVDMLINKADNDMYKLKRSKKACDKVQI